MHKVGITEVGNNCIRLELLRSELVHKVGITGVGITA